MKAYVYILEDEAGEFYIGATRNIEERIKQHLSKTTLSTSGLKNPKLALVQEFNSMTEARKVELRIKKLKRKDYVRKMIEDGFIKLALKL